MKNILIIKFKVFIYWRFIKILYKWEIKASLYFVYWEPIKEKLYKFENMPNNL